MGTPETRKATRRKVLAIAGTFLLAAACFVGGYLLRDARGDVPLVSIVSQGSDASKSASDLGNRLEEVQGILASESYSPPSLDASTAASINALLKSTGDNYAKYYTQDQYENYLKQNSGEYAGIGILLSEYNGNAYVVRVYDGTPAAQAGLQVGDFITEVNGEKRTTWSLDDVTSLIKGQQGDTVELGWRRPETISSAGGDTYSATMTLETIDIPNVSYRMLDGNIGYISIAQFSKDSTDAVSAAIGDLESQGVTGYVIDLRGNPGGYLTSVVDITSMFLSSGTVVQISSPSSGVTTDTVTGNHLTDKPVVVLVNQNSASASEIFAAALQDHNRADVVGTVTFGKGTVQTVKELSFGGAIKYTIAHYLTPNGNDIDGVGVTPDIVVDMDPTLRNDPETDTQLAAALADCQGLVTTSSTSTTDSTTSTQTTDSVAAAQTTDTTAGGSSTPAG